MGWLVQHHMHSAGDTVEWRGQQAMRTDIWAQIGRYQPLATWQDVVRSIAHGGGAELRKVKISLKA